ncbi:MAG TPA: hypothetical protein PKE45_16520, partial [Caldilineaceae bacterium]|nr:hypothetical protein [Caldilineaceae bacterium]
MASVQSTRTQSPADLPIFVRDRRRKGFFTIENALFDQYGAQLKAQQIRHAADALALPAGYLAEASAYLARLLLARVPIRCGMHLSRIERRGDTLVARAEG